MNPSKLRKFYTNKMELEQHNGRHISYIMRLKDKKLHLPPIAHHSHGKNDIQAYVINNLAKRMGLNSKNFISAVNCSYRRDSILICIATKYLADCNSDPITYPPQQIIPTIEAIFNEATDEHIKRHRKNWNSQEKIGLASCVKTLKNILKENDKLKDTLIVIIEFITKYLK